MDIWYPEKEKQIEMDWIMAKYFWSYQRATDYTTGIMHSKESRGKVRWKSDASKTSARVALFQFQQGKMVLIGY